MIRETYELYLTDPEAFLSGGSGYCFALYPQGYFSGEGPTDWIRFKDTVVEYEFDRVDITQFALKCLSKEEHELRVTQELALNKVEERKQKLLTLPHLTEVPSV